MTIPNVRNTSTRTKRVLLAGLSPSVSANTAAIYRDALIAALAKMGIQAQVPPSAPLARLTMEPQLEVVIPVDRVGKVFNRDTQLLMLANAHALLAVQHYADATQRPMSERNAVGGGPSSDATRSTGSDSSTGNNTKREADHTGGDGVAQLADSLAFLGRVGRALGNLPKAKNSGPELSLTMSTPNGGHSGRP